MNFLHVLSFLLSVSLLVSARRDGDKIVIQDPFGGPGLVLTENNIVAGQNGPFGGPIVISRGKKGGSNIVLGRRRRSMI